MPDYLTEARASLEATPGLDGSPHAVMAASRTAALVSIAESLARIAEAVTAPPLLKALVPTPGPVIGYALWDGSTLGGTLWVSPHATEIGRRSGFGGRVVEVREVQP